jgi:hypothetical protein
MKILTFFPNNKKSNAFCDTISIGYCCDF